MAKETPLMQQYNRIKAKYPDALLLFRVGDFYETFNQDAVKTAQALGIVLTKRANGAASEMDLAGFPYHALDVYLPKLVKSGYRVAICEQLEDPKQAKTIVKRGVTEMITPGLTNNDKILDHKTNNFLASVYFETNVWGIALIDISTGEFFCTEGHKSYIENVLQSFKPSEIIMAKSSVKKFIEHIGTQFYTYGIDDWVYQSEYAKEKLLDQFGTHSLKGFGIDDLHIAIIASGAILHYLSENQQSQLQHLNQIARLYPKEFVWLDKFTILNLELIDTAKKEGKSLLEILDLTHTAMGSRLLKKWLVMPLTHSERIIERNSTVGLFISSPEIAASIKFQIKQIGDFERLAAKIAIGRINPREAVHLKNALTALLPIKKICSESSLAFLNKLSDQINPCELLVKKIAHTLPDDAPPVLHRGNVIAVGVNAELDELRHIAESGKDMILDIQKREALRTGITSLKANFNHVFGYYLEVTHTHKDKVPSEWVRKQTLANAERYITQELKDLEEKILNADEKIGALEEKIFLELVQYLSDYIPALQINAQVVAQLDCLLAFAEAAQKYNYCPPKINNSLQIKISQGRHPVIERMLPLESPYVANDIFLDNEQQQILIITGPNMAGKSAVLRQTALICLMAQIGSYVPAQEANLGIVDKIFTRVGASDNLSSGESTFMTEMNEAANIVNNISERSLILLDELGRGTSTYDGISIAWSIAEYLHHHKSYKPKTLFATHYHELNELAKKYDRIHNFHVATKEIGQEVIFLRKLEPGGAHHSFGIHVAKMAGMPNSIIARAQQILEELEQKHIAADLTDKVKKIDKKNYQLKIFEMEDPRLNALKDKLEQLDINTLTPVEALMKLSEMKKIVSKT